VPLKERNQRKSENARETLSHVVYTQRYVGNVRGIEETINVLSRGKLRVRPVSYAPVRLHGGQTVKVPFTDGHRQQSRATNDEIARQNGPAGRSFFGGL